MASAQPAKRVAGSQWWAVLQRTPLAVNSRNATPPRRFAEGGEKIGVKPAHSVPRASAKILRGSCRLRWARSAAPNGRRGPWPAIQAGAHGATSRARRTTGESGPAAVRLLDREHAIYRAA